MRKVSKILATALFSGSVAFSSVLRSSGAKAANLYDIITWTSGTNNSTVPSLKYIGFEFSVGTDAWINSLSSWVTSSTWTGLHNITLYDVTDPSAVLVRSKTISGSQGGATPNCSYAPLDPSTSALGGFCSIAINNYQLQSGKKYSLSSSYGGLLGGDPTYLTGLTSSQLSLASGVTYIANTISTNYETPPMSTLALPSNTYGNFGPNIGFGGGPTPPPSVPAPLPLIGATFAFSYSRKIRSRLAQVRR